LDDLISQVSDLTEDIAHHVGASAPASSAAQGNVANHSGSLDDAIDAELGRMEDAAPAGATARESLAVEVQPTTEAAPRLASGKVVQLGKSKPRPAPAPPTPDPAAAPAPAPPQPPVTARPPEPAATPVETHQSPPDMPHAAGAIGFAAGMACKLLDLFDRPFRWCGPSARYVLGWVAFGLFFAAAFLFLLTFFQ
jgi:hypothetical protein